MNAANDKYFELAQIFQYLKDRKEFRVRTAMQSIVSDGMQYMPVVKTDGESVSGDEVTLACGRMGIQPKEVSISTTPFDMVQAKHDLKRILKLPISQRALMAARSAEIWSRNGRKKRYDARRFAAQLFEVSLDSFDRANKVLTSGNVFLIDQVAHDEITVTHATKIVSVVQDTTSLSTSGMLGKLASPILEPRKLVLRMK